MADEIVKFYGVKDTLKILRQVEPDIYKQFRKDVRDIGKPATRAIESTTPAVIPLSGMMNNGRVGYSGVRASISITPGQRSKAFGSTTSNLAAIIATGRNKQYGFNIADMAGRGKSRSRATQSRQYTRNGKTMRHALNGQGANMIDVLTARIGKASRFVYPAIENQLPAIRRQFEISLDSATAMINRKLNRR